jgi:L,D-transpeptidase ErfK/SrfK
MSPVFLVFLFFGQITGGEFLHTVEPGESLTTIGARFGVDVRVLAEANGLKTEARLQQGQTLRIDNRHIVPASGGAEIVINIPQRMLFHFEGAEASCSFPVAAGKPSWKTPVGEFEIVRMEEDPTWDVPASIQEEMRRAGKPVLTHVPPSPENPLGKYWIGLSLPGIGVHGTNAPSSIYKLATHGCIRLHPDDIRTLFPKVETGTRGHTIYEPVLLTKAGDRVFLEVHADAYKKAPDPFSKVLGLARDGGFLEMLDLRLVREVIKKHDGIARDVTR